MLLTAVLDTSSVVLLTTGDCLLGHKKTHRHVPAIALKKNLLVSMNNPTDGQAFQSLLKP